MVGLYATYLRMMSWQTVPTAMMCFILYVRIVIEYAQPGLRLVTLYNQSRYTAELKTREVPPQHL